MLVERIDELSLQHHDFGGRPNTLLAGFVRRIDRLKAELVGPDEYLRWAGVADPMDSPEAALEREFAEIYRTHERMLAETGARDAGDLIVDAISLARKQPGLARRFEHLLLDDAQELDLAPATLALRGRRRAGPDRRRRSARPRCAASAARARRGCASFAGPGRARRSSWSASQRCPERIWTAAASALRVAGVERLCRRAAPRGSGGEVELWRCANERSQAQAVAVDIERLLAREGVDAGPDRGVRARDHATRARRSGWRSRSGRSPTGWSARRPSSSAPRSATCSPGCGCWPIPTDAGAVVRALARPPIELRSVDIARCTQIARRRKLDMVAALAAATESPQVPPEARERIRVFLKLYRASLAAIDTSRPDLYVHRLIDRLGLRRQQLFAAQADVVERLRALASFGELAAAFVRRSPQATPREFARSIAAVADFGLREQEEPELAAAAGGPGPDPRGGRRPRGRPRLRDRAARRSGRRTRPEPIPDALLREELPADDEDGHRRGRWARRCTWR